jgi:hypothetical protein
MNYLWACLYFITDLEIAKISTQITAVLEWQHCSSLSTKSLPHYYSAVTDVTTMTGMTSIAGIAAMIDRQP